MAKVIKGVVKGNVIVPEEPLSLPEGTRVTINLPSKLCLLRHAGVWRYRDDLDRVIEEIYL